jgi:hypothetical protein
MIYLKELPKRFGSIRLEMAERALASTNPAPTGLEPEREPEKTEKIMPTEKGIEQLLPKRE